MNDETEEERVTVLGPDGPQIRIWGRLGGFCEIEPPSIKKGDH